MGYFNIFYKITRIIDMLTRKRNRRFIIILLIIIGIIFLLHNKGYCAQADSEFVTDTSEFILSEYDTMCDTIYTKFLQTYNSNNTNKAKFDEMFTKINQGYYPYLVSYRDNVGDLFYRIFFYRTTYDTTIFDTSLVYNDYMRVPSTGYNITIPNTEYIYYVNLNTNNPIFGSFNGWTANIAVPQILLYKIPKQFVDMMKIAGFLYDENSSTMVDIKDLLEEQNDKLDTINDSLTNSTYNEEVVEVDTSTIDNVSEEQITGLFTGVVSSFQNSLSTYGGTITKIIPLPHGGQIEIPSNIVSSHLGNLTALVEAFWYFVFGIYLFRFVSNLIHKIKTGDILNGYTNDNEIITSSML